MIRACFASPRDKLVFDLGFGLCVGLCFGMFRPSELPVQLKPGPT